MSLSEAYGAESVRHVTSQERATMIEMVSYPDVGTPLKHTANVITGYERDHTIDFLQFRRKTVDKTLLEVSRLEKRLTKLTQLLANPPIENNAPAGGLLWSLTSSKNQRKQIEQSIVDWENDATIPRCPFCQQEFSNYTFRRHHCRLCGRVVCGDPLTDCSKEVGLTVAARK